MKAFLTDLGDALKDRAWRWLKMILILAAVGGFLFLTTRGWLFAKVSFSSYTQEDEELAALLKSHVRMLSGAIGSRNLNDYENYKEAARYINRYFKTFGYTPDVQTIQVKDKIIGNIIAQKKGVELPQEIIIIGAHYDSYFNPGADANASGVACLLELARLLSDTKLKRTVLYVAFANSEQPYFMTDKMGSLMFARQLKEKSRHVAAVLILDSLGYYTNDNHSQRYPWLVGMLSPNQGNFIALVTNIRSLILARHVKKGLEGVLTFPVHLLIGFDFIDSDHSAFWKEDFKTVLLTDTGHYRYPYYHHLEDTYENLDYKNMGQLTRALKEAVVRMANQAPEAQ